MISSTRLALFPCATTEDLLDEALDEASPPSMIMGNMGSATLLFLPRRALGFDLPVALAGIGSVAIAGSGGTVISSAGTAGASDAGPGWAFSFPFPFSALELKPGRLRGVFSLVGGTGGGDGSDTGGSVEGGSSN